MFFSYTIFHFISARVSTTTREPRKPQARHQCWLNEHWLLLIVFFSPLEPKIICLWNRFTFNPTTMMMATWKRALVENQTRHIKVWRDVQFWAVHFTIVSHRRRYFALDFNQPAKSKIGFQLKVKELSILNDFSASSGRSEVQRVFRVTMAWLTNKSDIFLFFFWFNDTKQRRWRLLCLCFVKTLWRKNNEPIKLLKNHPSWAIAKWLHSQLKLSLRKKSLKRWDVRQSPFRNEANKLCWWVN